MIDWHSHILPGMDDGSRSVAESLSILKMMCEQGIDIVVATPHFYANDEAVDVFLERRKESYDQLLKHMSPDNPKLLLGAEVRYYQGISRMSDLNRLCIQGSKLFLLEMPFSKWTEYTVRELVELAGSKNLTVVLAHIERYLKFQSRSVWDRLYESGILMQVNANFFADITTRRKALSLLKNNAVHLVGSDSHNTTSRTPRMAKAFEVVQKKMGKDFIAQMNEYSYSVMQKNIKNFIMEG